LFATNREYQPTIFISHKCQLRLVLEDTRHTAPKRDLVLTRDVARAHRCFDALLTRKVASFSELAVRECIDGRYLRRILRLAFWALDFVRSIVAGTLPLDLTATALIRRTALPLDWRQRQTLGFS